MAKRKNETKEGAGGIKKDLLRLMIADAIILLICLGAGALIGLCMYGSKAVGILYLVRMVCFLAGGVLLLAGAIMILHTRGISSFAKSFSNTPGDMGNSASNMNNTAGNSKNSKGRVLFQTIPLFVFCLQAGAVTIAVGLIADSMFRSLIL